MRIANAKPQTQPQNIVEPRRRRPGQPVEGPILESTFAPVQEQRCGS